MISAERNKATSTPALPGAAAGAVSDDAPVGLFRHSLLNQAMGTYLPATVAFRLINFVRIWLLTWWMTQQQFGLLSMILITMNVMVPLCSLGLNEAVVRYVPQHEARGTLRLFLWGSAGLLFAVTAISALLMILFSKALGVFFYAQVFTNPEEFERFSSDASLLAQISSIVIGLLIGYFFLLAFLKGLRMFTALAIVEVSHSLLFLAGAVAAWGSGHLSALTLTGIYGISMAIPILFFGLSLIRVFGKWKSQHHPIDDLDHLGLSGTLLRFSVWTMLAGVTWQILLSYPAWFLNKVHGNQVVAVFNLVRQVGQFVLIGAVAVSTVIMTAVTRTWETRGREAAIRQLSLGFRGTGLGLLVFCAIIALAKDYVFRLFSPVYAPGASILPLHLLFFLMAAYLAFLPGHFYLIEKTRHVFWPWAVGVAANVLYAIWLASPRLETVRESALWQALTPYTSAIFTTGFSHPHGLDSAAWCGVFAIATALILCLILIRTECSPLDRGTCILVAAAGLLATKPLLLSIGTALLVLIAFRTELIFTKDERRRVTGYVLGAMGHIPAIRMLWGRKNGSR